uniref:Uncharacterized protein n=1 Tax=Meloidogyne enterolobii TaxID=390850 RepID=A0A6V7VD01_MELEN|nr:unnamed protein product [Meloidogyne enterolobii]
MLFCLLHPMDHNTGPLARKSSTLCALLLVSIAALLVLPVTVQANANEVGVANHTLDGDQVMVKEGSMQLKTSLEYDEYKKHFPSVCDFKITPDNIELRYKGDVGCTVELLTTKTNMIKFTTGIDLTKSSCNLGVCKDNVAHFRDGFSNLMPFAYSRNNKDLKNLTEGPAYGDNDCAISKCARGCINQTFLEVSWSKCDEDIHAYTHLIGEYTPGLDQKNDYKMGEFKFNLEIFDNNSFIMDFEAGVEHLYNAAKKSLSCVKKEGAIAKPKTWEIKNGGEDLKDKYLLVFHLLPSNATQLPKGSGFEPGTKPKCDLFIRFNKPDYQFLYVPPPTTSTVTTTTKTTAAGTQQGNTTPPTAKVQEVKDTEKGSKVWIVVIVIIVVVVVIGVGFSVWYYMAKKQKEIDQKEHELKNMTIGKNYVINQFNKMDLDEAINKKILLYLYEPDVKERGLEAAGDFKHWKMGVRIG